jgi:hypothetical protein
VVAHYPVPIQEDIRDLLHDLLARGAAVDKTDPIALVDGVPAAVAEYVTDDDRTGALCVVDGEFAIRAAAALVMVPSNVAEEDVASGEIPDSAMENAREIVNILARLLNSASTPHLRLAEFHRWPGELPEGVEKLLATPEYRRDFLVTIDGYGDGRFSLLVN